MHEATERILRHFTFDHLPPALAEVSEPCSHLADYMAKDQQLEGPELTAGLRHLLEAKDCFVRAAIERDG